MVDKINLSGFEKINFFKNKTKSLKEPWLIKSIIKKSSKKKEKVNNYNINNNSTSISQKKDTSDSSEILSRENDKKNNIKNKFFKKNTQYAIKRRKASIIENMKKVKKRRSSNYDYVKIHKLRKITPPKNDKKKRNHTSTKNGQKFGKQGKNNEFEGEVSIFDKFNHNDDLLYKIKLKRGKNCNILDIN